MSISPLLQDLALSRSTVDRSAHLRKDKELIDRLASDPDTRVVPVFRGMAPVNDQQELMSLSAAEIAGLFPSAFLGIESGVAYFCAFVDQTFVDSHTPDAWRHLRAVGATLNARDAGLMVAAVALAHWHESHTRCPRCGGATVLSDAGWTRTCPHDSFVHFPRTDPAVIMLVTDHQDRALLARQSRWEQGWMSVLAGFVEAGESAEAAVVREISEEAGIDVDPGSVQYWGSQPWPFPNSLMLGYQATVLSQYSRTDRIELTVDGEEIAHAEWFSRDELLVAAGTKTIHLPPPVSIAHRLIVNWLGQPLPNESAFR